MNEVVIFEAAPFAFLMLFSMGGYYAFYKLLKHVDQMFPDRQRNRLF